jgi:hypothetical protein
MLGPQLKIASRLSRNHRRPQADDGSLELNPIAWAVRRAWQWRTDHLSDLGTPSTRNDTGRNILRPEHDDSHRLSKSPIERPHPDRRLGSSNSFSEAPSISPRTSDRAPRERECSHPTRPGRRASSRSAISGRRGSRRSGGLREFPWTAPLAWPDRGEAQEQDEPDRRAPHRE